MMLSMFSCAYKPLIYLIWQNLFESSAYFKMRFFNSLLLICNISLLILDMSFTRYRNYVYFLPNLSFCLPIVCSLLNDIFNDKKFIILSKSYLSNSLFYESIFWGHIKNFLANTTYQNFLLEVLQF